MTNESVVREQAETEAEVRAGWRVTLFLALGIPMFSVAAMLGPLAYLEGGVRMPSLPLILCSTPQAPRSGATATTLRSETLAGMSKKRMTTQLVRFPPGTSSPRHVHGGDLTVYVLKGTVRSEHAGLPLSTYGAGQVFHEPQGTVHEFIENPSATEWAELLAVMVHDEGAALTTFLD